MSNLLLIFEIVFLISLAFTSVASMFSWFYTRKLTNNIKSLFKNSYPKNISLQSFKDLNETITFLITKLIENEDYSKELNKLIIKFSFDEEFINDFKKILLNYKNKIIFWKKYGRYSAYTALIFGAISFISYYLFR